VRRVRDMTSPSPPLSFVNVSLTRPSPLPEQMESSTVLRPIRCYDKYYQLEEMEDRDTCTTELFLRADGGIEFGDTDGPRPASIEGSWSVPDGTNDYSMTITRTFGAGNDHTDVGEFAFALTRRYAGDMTTVGASVAVTGTMMSTSDTAPQGQEREVEVEVGYFNMIDATDERVGDDKKV